MTCTGCGSENHPSASFCASCGTKLESAHAATPAPMRPREFTPQPVLMLCSHCGQPMRPVPYFSSGFNVAKAMLLAIPFSFPGPLLFFLMRRDRLICCHCKTLITRNEAMPLLSGVSPSGALVPSISADGRMTMFDPEEDQATLQWQSRRQHRRAWTWGVASAGLTSFGLLMAGSADLQAGMLFLVSGAPLGIGAVFAGMRSRALARRAQQKRIHEQRTRVLELARAKGGKLNVSLVAADLRIDLVEAEALLTAMIDGQRVDMDVDDEGHISYVFPELRD
jgi:Double zinc ribbon